MPVQQVMIYRDSQVTMTLTYDDVTHLVQTVAIDNPNNLHFTYLVWLTSDPTTKFGGVITTSQIVIIPPSANILFFGLHDTRNTLSFSVGPG